MNPKVIVIDGKTYKDVNEMPPDVRQQYEQAMRSLGDADNNQIPDASESMNIFEDKDKDGVPDALENIVAGQSVVHSMKIIVDGREFNSLEDLPPETRARYEEALGTLDANRNGIPDFVEGMLNTSNQAVNASANYGVETPRRSAPMPVTPAMTPDTSNGWMLVLGGVFLVALCVAGAAGVWYFFLR